jgi:sirohydrochlorin cobaltochelatase
MLKNLKLRDRVITKHPGTGLAIVLAVMTGMVVGCQRESDVASNKPTIVLVAFGTSVHEARKVFDYIDAAARKRYPNHDIRWAFTSQFIIRKLKAQGIETQGLAEVIADLRAAGCKKIVLQSLHVAPGQEFREIEKVDTSGLSVAVGKALLTTDEDIDAVIGALARDIDAESANVVVCHGNHKHPQFNAQLIRLSERIESRHDNVVVCAVEGDRPGTAGLKQAKSLAAKSGRVNFIPLMIVAGDHVQNDVLGDEADSWKTIVSAKKTTCTKPLGYNDKILDIYFRHLDAAMKTLSQQEK